MDEAWDQPQRSRRHYILLLLALLAIFLMTIVFWKKWENDKARKEEEANRLRRVQQSLERTLWQKYKLGKAFVSMPEDWKFFGYNLLVLKAGSPDFVESSPTKGSAGGSLTRGMELRAAAIKLPDLLKGDPDEYFINKAQEKSDRIVNDISFTISSNDFRGLVNVSYLYARTSSDQFVYNLQLWFLTEDKEEAKKLFEQILASFEYEVT